MTLEWLLERVVVCPSGCWLWTGADSGTGRGGGYAKANFKTEDGWRTAYVHVEVFERMVGRIPEGHDVHHRCAEWSPMPRLNRRCVNPDHLEAVLPIENQRRKQR